ncbi:MAG: alpha/beta fold hydrolase [Phycisphaerae bacterium]
MLPIVLIHGFPFDATMWRHQVDFLRGKGLTVITPNLPGFAGTDAWERDRTSIEGFAEFVHGVIQNEAGGKAIVGGFSMGGYVLLALLRDYPESLAAAMLIDTRPDADSSEARANRLKAIDEIREKGPAGVYDGMVGKQLSKRPPAAVRDEARAIMEKQPGEAAANALWAMSKRRDQTDLLPGLTLPVLIVVGAEDGITPPSVALNMQSHMPHAMVVQIVGAGHLSPLEQPKAVNGAIETFLATVK